MMGELELGSRISIVIPHFNNSRYLDACLTSIYSQTVLPFEVLIIDDCSIASESSKAEILASAYGSQFFKNKMNVGVSGTRNIGLSQCLGDIYTTIDPDDFYISGDYLERVSAIFDDGFPGVVGGKAVYVDKEGVRLDREISKPIIMGDLKLSFFSRNIHIPINIFYRKELYEIVGPYDTQFRCYEDWDFKLRLACESVFHIEDVEIAYRIHQEGLSTMKRFDKCRALFLVFHKNVGNLNFKEKILVFNALFLSIPKKLKSVIFLLKH
jgi:glycosyltransferase involved in cell wall biosynthesis